MSTDPIAALTQELGAAADPSAQASIRVARADQLLRRGRFPEAVDDLDAAAAIHAAAGRAVDQARCTHLAATAARLGGDLDGAEQRARAALELDDTGPAAVSAETELGECAMARESFTDAAACFSRACRLGAALGMLPASQGALRNREGEAWSRGGDPLRAALTLKMAAGHFAAAGDAATARQVWIRVASAWMSSPHPQQADPIIEQVSADGRAAGDAAALAEVGLLRITRAIRAEQPAEALREARAAQQHALDAVLPLAYTTATHAIADLCDALGDRAGAYEALAVGWVTLGDLMGREAGQATFAPRLRALADAWGAEAFTAVRDAYSARRRR